jgi:hypothetical protein
VPHAIKLQEKFKDQGLHVLLVEVQGHKRDEIVPFMAQAWAGRVPLGVLGAGSPFSLPGDGIPKTGLVGVDGTLVWMGNGGSGVEKVLEEQLQKLHQVKPLDPALKGVVKDLNARNFGKALTTARGVAEKGNAKAKESAEALVAHLERTVETRLAAARRLAGAGRLYKAKIALQVLAKQVNGNKELVEKVNAEIKPLDDPSNKDEMAADKAVADAESLGTERSGREGAAGKLGEMLKKYPNVKVAKVAAELKEAYESKKALR